MNSHITIKVSKRNQIAVPAIARQQLNIHSGDHLLVDIQDGMIILIPQPENYSAALQGLHHEIWEGTGAHPYVTGERESWTDSPKN